MTRQQFAVVGQFVSADVAQNGSASPYYAFRNMREVDQIPKLVPEQPKELDPRVQKTVGTDAWKLLSRPLREPPFELLDRAQQEEMIESLVQQQRPLCNVRYDFARQRLGEGLGCDFGCDIYTTYQLQKIRGSVHTHFPYWVLLDDSFAQAGGGSVPTGVESVPTDVESFFGVPADGEKFALFSAAHRVMREINYDFVTRGRWQEPQTTDKSTAKQGFVINAMFLVFPAAPSGLGRLLGRMYENMQVCNEDSLLFQTED